MKILWVSPILPVPTTGTGTREFNLLKRLSAHHEFFVVSLRRPEEVKWLPSLEPYCAELVTVPFTPPAPPSTAKERWLHRARVWTLDLADPAPRYRNTYDLGLLAPHVARLLETNADIHLAHAIGLYAAPLINGLRGIPRIMTAIDVEYDKHRQFAWAAGRPAMRRLYAWVEWHKMIRFERAQLLGLDGCIAVSAADAKLLNRLSPSLPIDIVPNGADTAMLRPPEGTVRSASQVLFFGNWDYYPNCDASQFFCESIWPQVRRKCPQAQLVLAGPNAPEAIRRLHRPQGGVYFAGFVEDVRSCLWQAALVVVPLRMGGGTRLKILEALAAGCPVVSTSIGAKGLDLEPGQNIVITDDPNDFAREVAAMLESGERRERFAAAGRRAVVSHYDWESIAELQQAIYQKSIEWRQRGTWKNQSA